LHHCSLILDGLATGHIVGLPAIGVPGRERTNCSHEVIQRDAVVTLVKALSSVVQTDQTLLVHLLGLSCEFHNRVCDEL